MQLALHLFGRRLLHVYFELSPMETLEDDVPDTIPWCTREHADEA